MLGVNEQGGQWSCAGSWLVHMAALCHLNEPFWFNPVG